MPWRGASNGDGIAPDCVASIGAARRYRGHDNGRTDTGGAGKPEHIASIGRGISGWHKHALRQYGRQPAMAAIGRLAHGRIWTPLLSLALHWPEHAPGNPTAGACRSWRVMVARISGYISGTGRSIGHACGHGCRVADIVADRQPGRPDDIRGAGGRPDRCGARTVAALRPNA